MYGEQKASFLGKFLDLRHGIPSHDTFRRVFSLVKPEKIESCFVQWVKPFMASSSREVIAVDGKTIRRSFDRKRQQNPLHMVSAWASECGLVLGQKACDEKSNEIKVIPELLDLLDLEGNIVTTDAMGCQKAIAKQVVENGGDYVFGLKGNQKNMHDGAKAIFDTAKQKGWRGYEYDWYETTETGHGRRERRRYWTVKERPLYDQICWIWRQESWSGLNIVGIVESERTENGTTSNERRYYLSSMENNAKSFAKAVRGHWGVENGLHWVMDVVFKEDDDRNRTGFAQNNLALIRRIALNLIKQEKTQKGSIKARRKLAGWNDEYLLKVLNATG